MSNYSRLGNKEKYDPRLHTASLGDTRGKLTKDKKKISGKEGGATRCFQLAMALLIEQNSLKREMDKGAKLFCHSDLHMQMTNPKM